MLKFQWWSLWWRPRFCRCLSINNQSSTLFDAVGAYFVPTTNWFPNCLAQHEKSEKNRLWGLRLSPADRRGQGSFELTGAEQILDVLDVIQCVFLSTMVTLFLRWTCHITWSLLLHKTSDALTSGKCQQRRNKFKSGGFKFAILGVLLRCKGCLYEIAELKMAGQWGSINRQVRSLSPKCVECVMCQWAFLALHLRSTKKYNLCQTWTSCHLKDKKAWGSEGKHSFPTTNVA